MQINTKRDKQEELKNFAGVERFLRVEHYAFRDSIVLEEEIKLTDMGTS